MVSQANHCFENWEQKCKEVASQLKPWRPAYIPEYVAEETLERLFNVDRTTLKIAMKSEGLSSIKVVVATDTNPITCWPFSAEIALRIKHDINCING